MKQFKMSPNPNIKVNSGKPPYHKHVSHRIENNWESFKNTNSVNRHTIVKDMTVVKNKKSDTERTKFVRVITQYGIFTREVTVDQKRIIAFGVIHTLRSNGTFQEVSKGERSVRISKKAKNIKEKLPNEIKTIALKSADGTVKMYRLIKKSK